MLGIIALHARQPCPGQLMKQGFHRVLVNAQRERMRQHGHAARLPDQRHRGLRRQARTVRIPGFAVAQPAVEHLVLVFRVPLLQHHLREMRPSHHVFACKRLHVGPGHRKSQPVELLQHLAVAHLAPVADPFHLPHQFRILHIHPVAQHVHHAMRAIHAEFRARHQPDRPALARRQKPRQPRHRVVVRQRQRRQPRLDPRLHQLLGCEGSV